MSNPPKKMGMSLYADLLDTKATSSTISSAPVKYDGSNAAPKQDVEATKKKHDASLKFQPVRRPQAQPKSRPKQPSGSAFKLPSSSAGATVNASSPDPKNPASTPQQPQLGVRPSNFEDWVDEDDEDAYKYQERLRQERAERGGRKKKKKNKQETRVWDWDDIYDPTLPNSYADYKGSDEQYREIRDWKARLYYHQLKAKKSDGIGEAYSDEEREFKQPINRMFAPPPNLHFAPPSFDEESPRQPQPVVNNEDDYSSRPRSGDEYNRAYSIPHTSFAPASISDDATGEDAYERRMRMAAIQSEPPHISSPTRQPVQQPTPVQAIPSSLPGSEGNTIMNKAASDIAAKKAEALAKIAAVKAKLAASRSAEPDAPTARPHELSVSGQSETDTGLHPPPPPPPPSPPPPPPLAEDTGATVSRGPVRYTQPAQTLEAIDSQMDVESTPSERDAPKSNRPGQKGFAERLLKKYGWEKGQGLGAQGNGITTAIIAQAQKRKKRSDADGGGWAAPANMGKIVGGKRRKIEKTSDDDGQFGTMSEVIKLEGMLNGLDVDHEIAEGNLMQEIGDEMSNKYGTIERLFIWRTEMGGHDEVFVKFTSQLSALRAVNATDGMTFADNPVVARFFPSEKFANAEYA
ncbi:Hypothetical protein R9X50_00391700 [Acrodontium crateriforme]|uniref:G-patch domain-containing protein n=1 Tax=Acrodontium crateriforme TaxID=150365 RepID=A0AAQ3MA14_9PEZI|nr:Hypothetical protein R9X50_00391700 [Acrodontium crateriforme]